MEQLYPRLKSRIVFPILLLLAGLNTLNAQTCPTGEPQGSTAFNHDVSATGGVSIMQIKLPKMNPAEGMVTCANLCITITGILRTFRMENDDPAAGTTATLYYIRTDNISGPGLVTPISSSVAIDPYGPIPLGPNDGVPNSGTDFFSVTNDTIMNTTTICRNISDSATLAEFYGFDSLQYTYTINSLVAPQAAGNITMTFSTIAHANFRMSYCTCPAIVLPLNVHGFEVTKILESKARLDWNGFDGSQGDYKYVAEVSRDGRTFTAIASYDKLSSDNANYSSDYRANLGNGIYYFRIKQVYRNGYTRFSNIRQIELGNSAGPKFSVYPNPSTGIVGIKFDNNRNGRYGLRIYNALGQVLVNKNVSFSSSSYNQVAKLETGVYWIRLTDSETNESTVNQIIIK